jgi:gamma-glutamylcyclotransferase (GGCT)/AIG2-like uncharacterized protein YtfP
MLYFAYGSNLNRRAMARHCPRAQALTAARLDGYRLVFRGTIDIAPDKAGTVWGGLYKLTPACLRALDKYEDAPRLYHRAAVTVTGDGGPHQAMVYLMNQKHAAPPDLEHYRLIARGYADWKLDEAPLRRARLAVLRERT